MPSAAILGLSGLELTRAERDFFRAADPWGFILFARNVDNPDQLRRLTGDLRDAVGRDAVITVDQEGGRVQRLRPPHWADWVPPLDDAVHGARAVWLRYHLIGLELRDVGIDSDCAPCLDIASIETHPFLRNRCLGTDPETVAAMGRAAADGLLAAGVLPVIKHMPGHGRALVDSHLQMPLADVTLAEAEAWDFAPFRALADLPMGMTAHIAFPETGDLPATQNPALIQVIREVIGFDGLLMSDDLAMEALAGTVADRAARAVAAGCDLALFCNGDLAAMESVVAASGALTPQAADRARRALDRRLPMPAADIAALRREYQDLVGAVA